MKGVNGSARKFGVGGGIALGPTPLADVVREQMSVHSSPSPPRLPAHSPHASPHLSLDFKCRASSPGHFALFSSLFVLHQLRWLLPTTYNYDTSVDRLTATPNSMKEPPSDQSYIDRIRSWAKAKAHGGPRSTSGRATSILPVVENDQGVHTSPTLTATSSKNNAGSSSPGQAALKSTTTVNNSTADTEQTVAPAEAEGAGPSIEPKPASHRHDDPHHQRPTSPTAVNTTDHAVGDGVPGETGGQKKKKKSVWSRFYMTGKMILLHSWINVLLVFVPIGIVTKAIPGCPPGVVFAMNAIAIVPLAGLLSHATETVAAKLGDTIGALLNITFGNAVELIIL